MGKSGNGLKELRFEICTDELSEGREQKEMREYLNIHLRIWKWTVIKVRTNNWLKSDIGEAREGGHLEVKAEERL